MERAFEIHLGEADLHTAGELYFAVRERLAERGRPRGVTTAAFRHLSRAVDGIFGRTLRVRPSTPLQTMLPWPQRRAYWRRLGEALRREKLRLPDLEYAAWAHLTLLAGALFVLVAPWAGGSPTPDTVLILLGLTAGLYAALRKWCVGLARAFPDRAATWGDLARLLAASNQSRLEAELHPWSDVEIWDEVCRLIVAQTGAARLAITPETSL